MFQFAGLPLAHPMCSGRDTRALPRVGFPIRKSPDQRLFSSSPRLIAACHVLHRLQLPRHPPCALRILILSREHNRPAMEFSRCARRRRSAGQKAGRPPTGGGRIPVSQSSTARSAPEGAERRCRRHSRRVPAPDGAVRHQRRGRPRRLVPPHSLERR